MTDLKIGCFLKLKGVESSVGNPVSWIFLIWKSKKQPFLVVVKGIHEKSGHCIGIYDGNIFNEVGKFIMKLSTKNLENSLGEKWFRLNGEKLLSSFSVLHKSSQQ